MSFSPHRPRVPERDAGTTIDYEGGGNCYACAREEVSEEQSMKHISDSDYWKDAVKEEFTGQENNTTGQVHPESTETQATPIWISKRTRTVLLACGLVALVLIIWYSPRVPDRKSTRLNSSHLGTSYAVFCLKKKKKKKKAIISNIKTNNNIKQLN